MALFGKPTSRLEELGKVLARDPSSRQFLALADEQRRAGLLRESIDTLQRGLQFHPDYVAAHVALGRACQQAARSDEALAAFLAALRLDSSNLVAIRQSADLYLKKGEKVEAVKKLKLFRAVSPGDREIGELIDRLDSELGFEPTSRTTARVFATPPPPAFPPPSAARAPGAALPPVPSVFPAAPVPAPFPPPTPRPFVPPPAPSTPPSAAPASFAAETFAPREVSGTGIERESEQRPRPSAPPVPAEPVAPPPSEPPSPREEPFELTYDGEGPGGRTERPAEPDSDAPVTETLADLYARQGYLPEARAAFETLARRAADPVRAEQLRGRARSLVDEGKRKALRLRTWAEAFSRARKKVPGDSGVPGGSGERDEALPAMGEVLQALVDAGAGIRTAVLTDTEGLPLVAAGEGASRTGGPEEVLVAELTAFCKAVRRTKGDVGAGELSGLVLSGLSGGALVARVSPNYSLILSTVPGASRGRAKFLAARAAERLAPALS